MSIMPGKCNTRFFVLGTPEQIKMARQLIQEKVESYVGGGMGGGPMSGPPSQPMGGPPGNFGPSPQVRGTCFDLNIISERRWSVTYFLLCWCW